MHTASPPETVSIVTYEFEQDAAKRYLELCRGLYRDDRRWIPPVEQHVIAQFSASFPFYRKAGNAHRHFVALAGARPVAHVSAFVNADLRDTDGTAVGAVGFFECIDDRALADRLLRDACAWLATRHGRRRVWGPMQFDIWHGYRLLTHGFDTGIFFGEPYNKPYYVGLLKHSGFRVRKTWDSVVVSGRSALEALMTPWAEHYGNACRDGYRFSCIDVNEPATISILQHAIEDAYRRFLGLTRLSPDEFRNVFAAYAEALDPRFALGAWRPNGELAGFVIAYPDGADAMRAMLSCDSPLTGSRDIESRARRRAVFFMIGITHAESQRHRGLGGALFHESLRTLLTAGYVSVVFALVADDSPFWKFLTPYRFAAHKQYALYEANHED